MTRKMAIAVCVGPVYSYCTPSYSGSTLSGFENGRLEFEAIPDVLVEQDSDFKFMTPAQAAFKLEIILHYLACF